MQHHNGRAVWVSALLHINLVTFANIQHALIERVDRRKEMLHCALLARELIHKLPI
jgi:hypothetical protein